MAVQHEPKHLHGIVDMGSNGIRFSITSLQPPTARIMPTLYQHRAAISLYDAQYSATGERQPISATVTNSVITSLRHFKRTCNDFKVPSQNVTILATEATRTAINSEAFRQAIKDSLDWNVTMLPKEEEGRVGAMGIASSLPTASGLVMDLGGGSTQLSWLIKPHDTDEILMPSAGAVSMPYGAAAMTRRLAEAQRSGSVKALKHEIKTNVRDAYTTLAVPSSLEEQAKANGGFSLYLSGGGFRGWGYVLMSRHKIQPYPIPLINGFRVARKHFEATDIVEEAATASLEDKDDGIFRVSERRATQVPAVALLVTALIEALPQILDIRFCQGGVREGYLYKSFPPEMRSQHPLLVATQPYGDGVSSEHIAKLLQDAVPDGTSTPTESLLFGSDLLEAFANLMYYHSNHSKDIIASAALRSTTTGILAGTHGILHEHRAILALLLCARWGGALSPVDELFKSNLESLVKDPSTLWYINYLGAISSFVAACHPAGVTDGPERLSFQASWSVDLKQRPQINLRISASKEVDLLELEEFTKAIEKVGKPKRWIGGKAGVGYKVEVETDVKRA